MLKIDHLILGKVAEIKWFPNTIFFKAILQANYQMRWKITENAGKP